ncbi:MAG: methylated-DNA--[protein]-cysteine S-methyltransferase [Cyanobacteria bacterium P01_D01_bin.123]
MKALPEAKIYDAETYQHIAKAIDFIRQNHLYQPDLKTIAEHVHLSEYHFQRLFTEWAGISPKRFLQYVTVEYAKSKINETKSILELSLDSGLSSPGRLHDLFVTLEAMSPGEFKAGGKGLQIRYGACLTPFGYCAIAATERGICYLHFLDRNDEAIAERHLRAEWPNADLVRDRLRVESICDRMFRSSTSERTPLVLHVKGTNFQIQVWRALLKVPFGGITTYRDLAEFMGQPTATRATGNALGRNPVGYLIPCHRVIRASGELGNYRWGAGRKPVLLGWEASQTQNVV